MGNLLELFVKIIILLAIGWSFAKLRIITVEMKGKLSTFLVNIVLYFSILASSQQELSRESIRDFLLVLVVSSIYYAVSLSLMYCLGKALRFPPDERAIFTTMVTFANVAFIGIPMAGELFGEKGTLYAVTYTTSYNLFFYSFGVIILRSGVGMQKGFSLKNVLKNTALEISMLGLLLYVLPFRLPTLVTATFSSVGDMMTPLSMIIIGAEIAEMNPLALLKDPKSYLVSALRLLILPFLMLGIVKLLGITGNAGVTIVLLTALPAGSLNAIMSQEYGCAPAYAARAVAQSMLLMLLTLPLVILAAQAVLL